MNVALLADTAWLDEELAAFHYLVVGLLDEQVRVIQVLPGDLEMDDSSLFGRRIEWAESKWPAVNRRRLARLAEDLRKIDVHLIHAMDQRLWQGAASLGDQLHLPVIFRANDAAAVDLAPRIAAATDVDRVAFTGSTEPITHALRERLPEEAIIEDVPTGVHPGPEPTGGPRAEALCAVISGNGDFDEHYDLLLHGMAQVARTFPQTQFFFDGQGGDQHGIWKAARELKLLHNMSLIPRRLGHRELLLRADLLVHPQPLGQSRTVTLQAMGNSLPVVARADPWLDYLIDGETAWVARDPTSERWTALLDHAISDHDAARELGRSARDWIREHRPVSRQIARITTLYRRLTGETIKFPTEEQ